MNWKSFSLGFLLAVVLSIVGFGWLTNEISKVPMTLPPKMYFETNNRVPGEGYLHFEGSIGGIEPIANPENIFSGSCIEASSICRTQDVKMIGANQLGPINTDTYRITTWSPDVVVAESANQGPECVPTRIKRPKHFEKRTVVWTAIQLFPPLSFRGPSSGASPSPLYVRSPKTLLEPPCGGRVQTGFVAV